MAINITLLKFIFVLIIYKNLYIINNIGSYAERIIKMCFDFNFLKQRGFL